MKVTKDVKKEQTNFDKFETLSQKELGFIRGGDGENVTTDGNEG